MRIMLTNDDGINSPGIYALAKSLSVQHEVTIVAPSVQRSGAAHSFTLNEPLRMEKQPIPGLEYIAAYAVNGTPVDCVKLGYGNLDIMPELVLSGINIGANLGTDVFYSGTVAAALEGAILGIPALAVSVCSLTPKHIESGVQAVRDVLPVLCGDCCEMLNVNVPDIPYETIKGIKYTGLSRQMYETKYEERIDTHNTKYYWIPSGNLTVVANDEDTDYRWIKEGYITVTPLHSDITDKDELSRLANK